MAKRIDLTGQKFGRLTVLGRDETRGGYWECLCDCGKSVSVKTNPLKSGSTKSCGCLNSENIHAKRRNSKDLTGQKFGNLTVLEYIKSGKRGTVWLCKCSLCGNERNFVASDLKKAKSCGCLEKQAAKNNIAELRSEFDEIGTNVGSLKRKEPNSNNKTSGIKGVCKIKSGGREYWCAYITFQKRRYMLKRSVDINECIKARKEAEERIHGEFLEWYDEYKKSGKY